MPHTHAHRRYADRPTPRFRPQPRRVAGSRPRSVPPMHPLRRAGMTQRFTLPSP